MSDPVKAAAKVIRQAARDGVIPVDPDKVYPREEWRDHIPSGYEDQTGYGQVSCACGWDSSDKLGWEEHIDAAERDGEGVGVTFIRMCVCAAKTDVHGPEHDPKCAMYDPRPVLDVSALFRGDYDELTAQELRDRFRRPWGERLPR